MQPHTCILLRIIISFFDRPKTVESFTGTDGLIAQMAAMTVHRAKRQTPMPVSRLTVFHGSAAGVRSRLHVPCSFVLLRLREAGNYFEAPTC
jgi:hypothetical protein